MHNKLFLLFCAFLCFVPYHARNYTLTFELFDATMNALYALL
jgi:hypothetical protein